MMVMMTPWMRRIHKWLGLLIGVQLLLWMASGLLMSLLDADQVRGREFRAPPPAQRAWPATALSADRVLAQAAVPVQTLSTGWLLDQPVYRLATEDGVLLADAGDGRAVALTPALAQRLAVASYTGPGRPGPAELVAPSLETRAHEGRVWRVAFADEEDTTVYLSQHGDVLEHRNRTWRVFDVFWMLHIMDYSGRKDFNNALVVSAAVGGLWLALSGTWLLITSFRLAEFIPARWRGRRELGVFAADGPRLRTVRAPAGDTVYAALARQGLQLPSNCGGGQSCGLCEVRVKGAAPPPTGADRAQLTARKLQAGHRLACNLKIAEGLDIEVPGGAGLWTEHTATVESIRALSPFLREIVLLPAVKPGLEYQPGAYLQVHVPEYTLGHARMEVPPEHRAEWAALDLPEHWHSKAPLRRSYSLSCPVDQAGGRLTLLARFCHGPQGRKALPPGKGSAWLYSLKAGDTVRFSGPFGDFAVMPGGREKVFIGGGAGMGPLRAMVRALLEGGAREPIHFWYGARNLRDAPYVDEMDSLAARFPNFRWRLVLSEPGGGSGSGPGDGMHARGLVHEVARQDVLGTHPDLRACDFYVCGPPAMLAATRALLRQLGVADERVAFDDFKV